MRINVLPLNVDGVSPLLEGERNRVTWGNCVRTDGWDATLIAYPQDATSPERRTTFGDFKDDLMRRYG